MIQNIEEDRNRIEQCKEKLLTKYCLQIAAYKLSSTWRSKEGQIMTTEVFHLLSFVWSINCFSWMPWAIWLVYFRSMYFEISIAFSIPFSIQNIDIKVALPGRGSKQDRTMWRKAAYKMLLTKCCLQIEWYVDGHRIGDEHVKKILLTKCCLQNAAYKLSYLLHEDRRRAK